MVEWIEYKGQKFPFVYNYYAMSNSIGRKDKIDDEKLLDHLVFYSIEAGCEEMDKPFTIKKGDKEVDLTVKDAGFIIGKVTPDYINGLILKFRGKEEDEDGKKK